MAITFGRVRVLISCRNDLGGPGSETWDLSTVDPATIRARADDLCRARAQLLGTAATVVGYAASLINFDETRPNSLFQIQQRLLGRGFGAPLSLTLGAGSPTGLALGQLDNRGEVFAGLRSTAARAVVYWNTGSRSLDRLCFPWLLTSRDFAFQAWAAGNNALAAWQNGVKTYESALCGGAAGTPPNKIPYGRWHRVEFGRLPAGWADAIRYMRGGDGMTQLAGVLVGGNAANKYPVNTHVTVYGRRNSRRGQGTRVKDGGHYRVGQPGAAFDSSTGLTVIPLACTVKDTSPDPCRVQGWIFPDKYEFRTVVGLQSQGHGTTRRATAKGLQRNALIA